LKKFDFAGYVTKNDIQCSDGVTIRHTAFAKNDGTTVPLVWQHDYSSPSNTLGFVELQHMDDGVWGEAYLNRTQKAIDAKELITHGDVNSFSIGARGIQKNGQDVVDGEIYEVSLVLRGANPGAKIEHVLQHSAYGDHYDEDQGIIYTGQELDLLFHSDDDEEEDIEDMSLTVGEVLETLTPEQEAVVEIALTEGVDNLTEEGLAILGTLSEDQTDAVLAVADAMDEYDDEEFDEGEEDFKPEEAVEVEEELKKKLNIHITLEEMIF
jgi:HK97 family phage prohead protease